MPVKTIIEPFRIKSVEPITWTTREQREELLRAAYYNLFLLPAADVLITGLCFTGFRRRRDVDPTKGRHHGGRRAPRRRPRLRPLP
jgi:hypothetical protein